ncbi:MAG: DUF3019 domain-containing protein [Gammaproteobacteria bacterium]|nr:DUF3019 domain-containing protein [Gammaproteobacteria bacterium]
MKFAIALIVMILSVHTVQAQDAELIISPSKCVALNKGQVCYQTLTITMKAPLQNEFCLFMGSQSEPLQCWQAVEVAEYRYRFASEKSVEFRLVGDRGQALSNSVVNVAWVYKQSRKRNRWRLF